MVMGSTKGRSHEAELDHYRMRRRDRRDFIFARLSRGRERRTAGRGERFRDNHRPLGVLKKAAYN